MRRVIGTVVPLLGFLWIYLLSLTLRVKVIDEGGEKALNDRHVLAFWHSRIFYMPFYFRQEKSGIACLVSPSGDGGIIDGVLRFFGFSTVRGSTFQHGRRALIALARIVRGGKNAAMIADGSRGPARKAQLGSIFLAKLTGVKIIPIAYGAKRKYEINSWDKTIFPAPFSKANMVFGRPMEVPKDSTDADLETLRQELEAELNRITGIADKFD
jgi:lysophospholipid acyltransferase (LPLAT)-like uncharacterized protein